MAQREESPAALAAAFPAEEDTQAPGGGAPSGGSARQQLCQCRWRRASLGLRGAINGQECAIVTKPNRSYRNGRRRRHDAIIYAPAPRGTRPKRYGPCEAGPRLLSSH